MKGAGFQYSTATFPVCQQPPPGKLTVPSSVQEGGGNRKFYFTDDSDSTDNMFLVKNSDSFCVNSFDHALCASKNVTCYCKICEYSEGHHDMSDLERDVEQLYRDVKSQYKDVNSQVKVTQSYRDSTDDIPMHCLEHISDSRSEPPSLCHEMFSTVPCTNSNDMEGHVHVNSCGDIKECIIEASVNSQKV